MLLRMFLKMCLLVSAISIGCCSVAISNSRTASDSQYREDIDFDKHGRREEYLFKVIEDPLYSPRTRGEAVMHLWSRCQKPGLPTLERLLKLPPNAWKGSDHEILFAAETSILHYLGATSRREGEKVLADFCRRVLKEKKSVYDWGETLACLMRIGSYWEFFEWSQCSNKDDIILVLQCFEWGSTKIDENADWQEELLRLRANDRAYYDVIAGMITETDWVSKLRPSNEADCKKLEDLVTQFGDNDPKIRENAREELLKAGIEAYAVLAAGKKSKDITVGTTCNVILSKYPFIIPIKAKENIAKFHLDRDVQLLAVLLESKDKSLSAAAHARLKKITAADLPAKREAWDKWYVENAPYAEWNEKKGRYDINADAKESGLELFKWDLIPEGDRAKWSDIKPEERDKLVGEAKQKYQDMLDKEEADRLAFNKPYDDLDKEKYGEIEGD